MDIEGFVKVALPNFSSLAYYTYLFFSPVNRRIEWRPCQVRRPGKRFPIKRPELNAAPFFPFINDANERSLLRVSLMLVTSGPVDADAPISAYRAADLNARVLPDGHLNVTI